MRREDEMISYWNLGSQLILVKKMIREVLGTRLIDIFRIEENRGDEMTSCWNLANRLPLDKKMTRQVLETR